MLLNNPKDRPQEKPEDRPEGYYAKEFKGVFCIFETHHVGKCGRPVEPGKLKCRFHRHGKETTKAVKRKRKYSGFSRYREETGEFQDRVPKA